MTSLIFCLENPEKFQNFNTNFHYLHFFKIYNEFSTIQREILIIPQFSAQQIKSNIKFLSNFLSTKVQHWNWNKTKLRKERKKSVITENVNALFVLNFNFEKNIEKNGNKNQSEIIIIFSISKNFFFSLYSSIFDKFIMDFFVWFFVGFFKLEYWWFYRYYKKGALPILIEFFQLLSPSLSK